MRYDGKIIAKLIFQLPPNFLTTFTFAISSCSTFFASSSESFFLQQYWNKAVFYRCCGLIVVRKED